MSTLLSRIIVLVMGMLCCVASAEMGGNHQRLTYDEPAKVWTDALPVGNGSLGAMVFGGIKSELIQFNHDTLWAGGPHSYSRKGASKYLPQLRQLLFNGKQKEAVELAMAQFMSQPLRQAPYQSFGELVLAFGEAATLAPRPFAEGAVKINFQPAADPAPEGWQVDSGAQYTPERGYGWAKTIGTRNRKKSGDFLNDTLVAIIGNHTLREFRLDIEPGDYLLTLQHGDAHASKLDMLYCEDAMPLRSVTSVGEFQQLTRQVSVDRKGLVLKFRRKIDGSGTSLNWLVVEPRAKLTAAEWAKGDMSDQVTEYRRELDLDGAVATTKFKKDGVTYRRSVFASNPDGVIAVRIAADQPEKVSFTAKLTTLHKKSPALARIDDRTFQLTGVVDDYGSYLKKFKSNRTTLCTSQFSSL